MSKTKLLFVFRAMANEQYFHKLIVDIAQGLSLCFETSFKKELKIFELRVSGTKEELSSLSDLLSQIPFSLFFYFEKVEVLDDGMVIEPQSDADFPLFLSEVQRPLYSFGLFQDLDKQAAFPYNGHLFLEGVDVLGDECAKDGVVALSIRALAQKLLAGEEVFVQTLYGAKIASLNPSEREWIMPMDLASLELLFRIDKAQSTALASWEKPVLFLAPKQLLANELESTYSSKISLHAPIVLAFGEAVVMPYDSFLQILAICLKEFDVDILYLRSVDIHEHDVISQYPNAFFAPFIITEPLLLTVTHNSTLFILSKQRYLDSYPAYARSLAGLDEDCVCVHLSYDLPTVGAILQDGRLKKVLEISFPLRVGSWLKEILDDEVGAKLIKNFSNTYPYVNDLLFDESMHKIQLSSIAQSSNVFDVLGVVYQLLYDYHENFNQAKLKMLKFADEFLGVKGPRIDYKIVASDVGVRLEHLKILRSTMSFRLAGVDEQTLAFGVLDSLAEFFGNFARDLCENFAIKKVAISGSMLSFTPFSNRLLHFLPPNIALVLPTDLPIDCIRYS